MRPFWAKPELVSDVCELYGVALRAGVGEGALLHQHVVGPIRRGFQGALLVDSGSIPGEVAAARSKWQDD
jgi:hypothetical protein